MEIFLEWEREDRREEGSWRIIRFVVFVQHPQRMLYGSKHTRGALQDLHLSVISKLAGFEIDDEFYHKTHKPGTYGKLTKWH